MNWVVKQMLQLHPCFHGPCLSHPLLHLLPLPPPCCLSIILHVIFYTLFSIHLLFSGLAVASCSPLPHHPKNLSPSWPSWVSFSGHQEQQQIALLLYTPRYPWLVASGGLIAVVCFQNADVTQKMGMMRKKIENKESNLALLFSRPLKKRPHIWQIKMTRTRPARDSFYLAYIIYEGSFTLKSYMGLNNFFVVKI